MLAKRVLADSVIENPHETADALWGASHEWDINYLMSTAGIQIVLETLEMTAFGKLQINVSKDGQSPNRICMNLMARILAFWSDPAGQEKLNPGCLIPSLGMVVWVKSLFLLSMLLVTIESIVKKCIDFIMVQHFGC